MKATTKYFSAGSIIAESQETATGLMVITSGSVAVEMPMGQSEPSDAGPSDKADGGKALMYVFKRGCVLSTRMGPLFLIDDRLVI